jgi:hypothetical protein
LGFPSRVLGTRFHRVDFNDQGTACLCFLPPLAVKSKPPAMRVVVDSVHALKKIVLTFMLERINFQGFFE